MLSFTIYLTDIHEESEKSFEEILDRISGYSEEQIPVPFLASIIDINASTLNTRIKREHIEVAVKNRTNRITKEQARRFAFLNEPAIRRWPTIHELSSTYHVAQQTLSYWRKKGKLQGQQDLTKNLRINPLNIEQLSFMVQTKDAPDMLEIEGKKFYSIVKAAKDAALNLVDEEDFSFKEEKERLYKRFHRRAFTKVVESKKQNRTFYFSEQTYFEMINPAQAKRGTRMQSASPKLIEPIEPVKPIKQKPAPAPCPSLETKIMPQSIKTIHSIYYGLPELPNTAVAQPKKENKQKELKPKKNYLTYNPSSLPSFSECVKGRRIMYAGFEGIIKEIIDNDPYRPQIKVHFSNKGPYGLENLLLVVKNKFA